MSIWDNPELKSGGDYFKFSEPGDSITGTVISIGVQQWEDGSKSPKITLTTENGEEKIVTAGQVRLKLALVEQRPEIGDKIKITFTDVEKRAGGKTLKNFEVLVKKGNGSAKPAEGLDPDVIKAMQDKLGATQVPF